MALVSDDLLILNVAALFADRYQACSCADSQLVATRLVSLHQSQHPHVIGNQTVNVDPAVLQVDHQDMVLVFSSSIRFLIVVYLGISG